MRETLIETPFGTMVVIVNGARELYVRHPDGQEVEVNRVRYRVRLYLEDYGTGFELQRDKHNSTVHALTVERWTSERGFMTGSAAARDKLKATLLPLIRAWAKANPETLRRGELAVIENQLGVLDAEVLKIDEELQRICAKQSQLLSRQHWLKSGGAL